MHTNKLVFTPNVNSSKPKIIKYPTHYHMANPLTLLACINSQELKQKLFESTKINLNILT